MRFSDRGVSQTLAAVLCILEPLVILFGCSLSGTKLIYTILPIIVEEFKHITISLHSGMGALKYITAHIISIISTTFSALSIAYFTVGTEGIFAAIIIVNSVHLIVFTALMICFSVGSGRITAGKVKDTENV
jgi:hypothetical protein